MNESTKKGLIMAGILAGSLVAPSVFAEILPGQVDASSATAILESDGLTSIKNIGGTMLGLAAVAVTIKWVKAALFG